MALTYRVRRYRPRIEGLFARIERWTNTLDATDVFWRSISKDNITTWYGKTPESRIADPADPSRIFSWLICESHDDKGNVIVYGYKEEDSARIFEDTLGNALVKAHERNRTTSSRSAQRYLKRIRYGNRAPYFPVLKDDAHWPEPQDAAATRRKQLPGCSRSSSTTASTTPTHRRRSETGKWPARSDPFSSYRAGFEVRTYRLCQRVLMFHHFPGEAGVGRDCLVRSTDFTYSDEVDPTDVRNPVYTFLRAVTQTGYRRNRRRLRLAQPAARRIRVHRAHRAGHGGGGRSGEPGEPAHRSGWQRLPLDRPARRGHSRHPHRAGRRLVLQAQPQPDPGQAA